MTASVKGAFLLVAMLLAVSLSSVLQPSQTGIDSTTIADLRTAIPRNFGSWTEVAVESLAIVNPQQQETLDRIYSQVVERSYQDSQTGRVVMLSLAYGGVQSKQSQVHRPEVCYPAQGFQIETSRKGVVATSLGEIPVQRLFARLGPRSEPITYWIRIGDRLARDWFEQKLAVVSRGLSGQVADGLLVRVSNIDGDLSASYALHDRFVADLLAALSPDMRKMLLGKLS
jgi:EpsI family protein